MTTENSDFVDQLSLSTSEDRVDLLTKAFLTNDAKIVANALRACARAAKLTADSDGLSPRHFALLNSTRSLRLRTVLAVMKALNLKLGINAPVA